MWVWLSNSGVMSEVLEKPVKKRDPVVTRAKLLEAAQNVFTEKGYEGAGLREICRNAGVDQALVKRYFGSKEGLFREIFDTGTWMTDMQSVPRESLGEAIADFWINREKTSKGFDATMALLRSVGSHQVNAQLREVVEDQHINRLAKIIGGRNAYQRAALIIAQIIGIDTSRRVLRVEALSDDNKKVVRQLWARQIQALVDNV